MSCYFNDLEQIRYDMMEELKVDSKAEYDVADMFTVSRCCRTCLCETVYMPRLAMSGFVVPSMLSARC